MQDAFIYDGLRTPIGRHAGGLAPVRPDDLLGGVIKDLVARSSFKAEDFEDVDRRLHQPGRRGCPQRRPPRGAARRAADQRSPGSPSIASAAAALPR